MADPAAAQIRSADLNEAQQTLEMTWGDSHSSSYPLKYLRAECPCASCRSERQDALDNPFHILKGGLPSAELRNVEPVGRYGLRLVWADGHDTGIYTFEYLRQICPCETCRAQRPAEGRYVHGIHIPS
jgi:DUF971 family protein